MRKKLLFLIVLSVFTNCITTFAATQRFFTCAYDLSGNNRDMLQIVVNDFCNTEDGSDLFIQENRSESIEAQDFILNNANDDEYFVVLDLKTENAENPYPEIIPMELDIGTRISTNSSNCFGTNYRLIYFDDDETAINMSDNITHSNNNRLSCSIEKLGMYVIYYSSCLYNVRFYSELPCYDEDGNITASEEALYYELSGLKYNDIIEFPPLPQKEGFIFTGWKNFPIVYGGGAHIKFVDPQPQKVYLNENYYATWCPEDEYEPIIIEISPDESITKGNEHGKKITLKTNYGVFVEDEEFPDQWRDEYETAETEEEKQAILSDWKTQWNVVGSDEVMIESVKRIDDKTVEFTLSGNSSDKYTNSDIYIEFHCSLLRPEPYEEDGEIVDWIDTKIKPDSDGVRAEMYRSDNAVTLSKQSKPGTGGGGGVSRHTVTFDTNGGSSIQKQTVNRNAAVKEPEQPLREEYTFAGWFEDKELTKQFDFATKITKSITLYAKWDIADKTKDQIIFTIGKTAVSVFGEAQQNDTAPIISGDRAFLPARFVAENLGAVVGWDNETRKVTITKDDITIIITVDSGTALVNGKAVELDSPAFIENDRTYTPLRFIAESLGADVQWDEETQEITITK